MRFTKEQLFEAALALNSNDKKYTVSVEGDKIITRVKWMDATFFSLASITDKIKEFEYVVMIDDNGKYTELDKSVSVDKSTHSGGLNYNKSISVGKQMTFNKTISLGKNNQTGEIGTVDIEFNSEEYKKPVRTLLKNSGYKKKMGILGKVFIGASISVVIALIAAIILISQALKKEPITASEFESIAKTNGYMVGVDETLERKYDYVKNIRIAIDEKDDYQIELYVLSDSEYAKMILETNKSDLEKIASVDSNNVSTSVNSSTYEKYSASTSEYYLYVARIENTVLFVNAGIEHKEEVRKFIEKIGY